MVKIFASGVEVPLAVGAEVGATLTILQTDIFLLNMFGAFSTITVRGLIYIQARGCITITRPLHINQKQYFN